eukprot:1221641-Pyramimonas_sp.AAC.1
MRPNVRRGHAVPKLFGLTLVLVLLLVAYNPYLSIGPGAFLGFTRRSKAQNYRPRPEWPEVSPDM